MLSQPCGRASEQLIARSKALGLASFQSKSGTLNRAGGGAAGGEMDGFQAEFEEAIRFLQFSNRRYLLKKSNAVLSRADAIRDSQLHSEGLDSSGL